LSECDLALKLTLRHDAVTECRALEGERELASDAVEDGAARAGVVGGRCEHDAAQSATRPQRIDERVLVAEARRHLGRYRPGASPWRRRVGIERQVLHGELARGGLLSPDGVEQLQRPRVLAQPIDQQPARFDQREGQACNGLDRGGEIRLDGDGLGRLQEREIDPGLRLL
jgi:hypothetical protein